MREVNDLEKLCIVDLFFFFFLILFSAWSSMFPWEDRQT